MHFSYTALITFLKQSQVLTILRQILQKVRGKRYAWSFFFCKSDAEFLCSERNRSKGEDCNARLKNTSEKWGFPGREFIIDPGVSRHLPGQQVGSKAVTWMDMGNISSGERPFCDVREKEVCDMAGCFSFLHVWSLLLFQGYGTLLMEEAERIAKEEHGSTRIAVISGVGTRNYYRKLGYELDGPYMVKELLD